MTDALTAPPASPDHQPADHTPLPIGEIVRSLSRFEGRAAFMYRDTVGLVTVGVGEMLPNVRAAQALPFHHRVTGTPAAPAEIAAEYARVRRLERGRPLSAYAPGVLVLAEAEIDALLARTVDGFLAKLRELFPGFDAFPVPAREALIDMAYNLGLGVPGGSHGLCGYHHLLASVRAGDWAAAAGQCSREGIGAARNSWTQGRFLASAPLGRVSGFGSVA